MTIYRSPDVRARRLAHWQAALRTGVAGLAMVSSQAVLANPSGGTVVAGNATITGQGSDRLRIDQSSDRVIINWDNFSINLGHGVDFRQPNARSIALNRVTGPEISQIMGELTANGQVYLINGNGIVFGKDAKVDVAGLVATSADIGNDMFMAGGALRFGTPGRKDAKIANHGTITVRDAGIAAFVAPQVANDGIITAHLGRIALGGARAFTLDLHGDNLIRFQVGDAVTHLDDKGALVDIGGVVDARGGSLLITASAARDLVNQSVRISTPQAGAMEIGADGKVSLVAAKVTIAAPGEVQVGKTVAMDLSSGTNSAVAATGAGGSLTISAARTILDGTINLDGSKTGGTAHITGSDFLSFGSILSASGADAGGHVQLDAGGFSLAGRITVNAGLGKGGSVDIHSSRRAIDTGDAFIDASGLHGGTIRYTSDQQIISSGKFRASGSHGFGGQIDVSAPRLDLFSAQFYAQGGIRGGRVRLGGEFQGGSGLIVDELPNALRLVATDAVTIDVSAIGTRGNAGEIVIWSDEKTTFLGTAIARGGLVSGMGGQIEISGKQTLVYRGTVETARDGQRGGRLLLDPKNIIIAEGSSAPSQYGLVLQAFASSFPAPVAAHGGLEAGDGFGSVSLDGNRLAVGVRSDDGMANDRADAGAVYLFSFADAMFSTPVLESIIGSGYAGGKNIAVDALQSGDFFGHSVSLDGTRLAVGARNDDGEGNVAIDSGAVYLFAFDDLSFSNGNLLGVLGVGYSGLASLAVDNLAAGDLFGAGVSLDGDRLAVSALFDDGATDATQDAGAVYLFSFTDSLFSNPSLQAIIGEGYTGGNNISLALDANDYFGSAISLDNLHVAVGAVFDDGEANAGFSTGAVYLFAFSSPTFDSGFLQSTIGLGYSGPNDFDLASLDASDHFGHSVSLDGDRLAVVAALDDGVEETAPNSGVVYLFTYPDGLAAAPGLVSRIGANYGGLGTSLSISGFDPGDTLSDVSLNGNRLAISVGNDDGRNNAVTDSGAVYLFTFADEKFSGGRQVGVLGAGYSDLTGLSLLGTGLEQFDGFGTSVSLNGNRLAVGAPFDDGADNAMFDVGAVYLFTFGDAQFSAPVLQSIIGSGYTGGKNLSVGRLATDDLFGYSVSLDGLRLAVGAPGDDGSNDSTGDSEAGAVYLFTFGSAAFDDGALARVLNFESFTGGSIAIEGAQFGSAVALHGNVIAVGAAGDAGMDPMFAQPDAGAVHIFDLGSPDFASTPVRLSTIGKSYEGSNDSDFADLSAGDRFGTAVSLDGLNLAVGAPGDDGFMDDFLDPGAVFLFSFASSAYDNASLDATIGAFYPGSNDFTPSGLGFGPFDSSYFGQSVALQGLQLAVGAVGDAGADGFQNGAGAVFLFTFGGSGFSSISQTGQIGSGYVGAGDYSLQLWDGEIGFQFGSAVSLDNNRLVAGASSNHGRNGSAQGSGAAYLFTFGDTQFGAPRLVDTLGAGYSGPDNLSVAGLAPDHEFGSSVSLNGLRLAVGAAGDRGGPGSLSNAGAVYLLSFADLAFSAPVLEAVVGASYTGGKNVSVALDEEDRFGASVSLFGQQLAVGAPGDAGLGDLTASAGAVYLFSFADSVFTGGMLRAMIGLDYAGANDIALGTLEISDNFGAGVALLGNALAVGAPGDDGNGNSVPDSGAAYLFTFGDALFSGGLLEGTIGAGYSGGKNISLPGLEVSDQFGTSLALAGDRLFVGAPGDDGQSNFFEDTGAVYRFSFGDMAFSSGFMTSTMGAGYFDGSDVDVSGLDNFDAFGSSVAASGLQLAIGAIFDGGQGNALEGTGAVYLFEDSDGGFGLRGIIGAGYSDVFDFPIGGLQQDDFLGSAVSLDQNRLVVGARGDDGFANTSANSGSVYLFTFTDSGFYSLTLAGTMGSGYGPQTNLDLLGDPGDNLGAAVSLRGNQLAIGVPGAAAAGGFGSEFGAVYLFTFADAAFSGPTLAGIIGQGYSGAGNFDVAVLEDGDRFGAAVSLDGLRLAVGAPGDNGFNNDTPGVGAVYLFSFANSSFDSPVLEAQVGRDYVGGKNVDVTDLVAGDQFGSSVSLQATQLVVGAPGDNGGSGLGDDIGAAHLFIFSNSIFNDGELIGTIGRGYESLSADFDLTSLQDGDRFGSAVSISGLGIAIGATGDDGALENAPDAGAAYLFKFNDSAFSGLALAATLGRDYGGGNDLSVGGVDAFDAFGSAVSLEGITLAVGSRGDRGVLEDQPGAGAVYLFSFLDSAFSAPNVHAIIGSGYTGAGFNSDLTVTGLQPFDEFGAGVALDKGRLVVGAPGDAGLADDRPGFGKLYLFTFAQDGIFGGLSLAGSIGSGYANGQSGSLGAQGIAAYDRFGMAVSLDGLRLAIGVPDDGGSSNLTQSSGAVYLFSFADADFASPVVEAILGVDYSGGKNLSVSNLQAFDYFGSSVSLRGTQLAVGAAGDDGDGDQSFEVGAVYLFSFDDLAFSNPVQRGILGLGYTGGNNLDVADLAEFDAFGTSVSLDDQLGRFRLAVGAPFDEGGNNDFASVGAVYLFSFDTALFEAPQLDARVGRDYDINIGGDAGIGDNYFFGSSVALDNNRLAIGAPGSGGFNLGTPGSGAVYLLTFSDADYSDASFEAIGLYPLVSIPLEQDDQFGSALSLDGTRLAVGARGDAGIGNFMTDAGAVYLFSFADASFNGAVLEGIVGQGYSGGKNIGLALDFADGFGASVSLNGNRLAVGAPFDDGRDDLQFDAGAVYLFTFADAAFNDGRLAATIGAGYRSTFGLDLTGTAAPSFVQLGAFDNFGKSVSLDGNRLAIGAPGDAGVIDGLSNAGAVYLFSFADAAFGGATLEGIVGHGYVGGKNLWPMAVDAEDQFGFAVSLDGNRLAVGAPGDAGTSNSDGNAGGVYLFSFADALFGGGMLEAVLGIDYGDDKNLTISGLEAGDRFGTSLSLDGNRLAVGAPGDDGAGNALSDSGAVYLLSFVDAQFSGGLTEAVFGTDYEGGKNLGILLDDGDNFGSAVSLDGTRLAVGAPGDDAFDQGLADAGAAYLFSFADLAFNAAVQRGIVGAGYNGPGDVDTVFTPFGFGSSSVFGTSLSLDGTRLAIGGPGITSGVTSPVASGAVYLLTFADLDFNGGTIADILAEGALNFGVNPDLDLDLDSFDLFGSAVSLDGNRLVVGAERDDSFGNNASLLDAGAVYLFTFADADFSGGQLRGTIGAGYTRGLSTPVFGLEHLDQFGTSVSLDGSRLAVGVPGDDGFGNSLTDSGAVYLFTFADADFAAPMLEGILGQGYTGGKNFDVPGLADNAFFGFSVSLDSNRLATGAVGLNGGTVYLFTFADAAFSAPNIASIIGAGASGPNDLSVPIALGDFFGYSLSLDGNRLAVGAQTDNGAGDSLTDSGAVYLFSFADAAFTGPVQEAIIGAGYAGGKNVSLAQLEAGDRFGSSVSLQGLRLAVGGTHDDGLENVAVDTGAVYLFTMPDTDFSGITLTGTIGRDYSGPGDLNISRLDSEDWFGRSLSLDGNRLAIGANLDDGATDFDGSQIGAVYLIGFADADFGSPSLLSIIGKGYDGANDISVSGLGLGELFGTGVALDDGRLVVGAPINPGPDSLSVAGAVYFFNLAGGAAGLPGLGFGDDPGADVTISASALAAVLAEGTGVELQANNDITVNSAILVDNPSGNGGNLRLEAGRSIFINGGITTDNGSLELYTNTVLVPTDLVDAFRDPGDSVVSFGPGGFVDAGTGAIDVILASGFGQTHFDSGAITLGDMTGGTIRVLNAGLTGNREVVIPAGVVLTATEAGNAITLSGGVFTNNGGAEALTMPGGGRFLVYSADYDDIMRGGLVGNNLYNREFLVNPPASIAQTGNLFLFQRQPVLTFTADDASRTYGQAAPGFTFQFTGLVNGDSDSYAFSGAPDLFDMASGNAGTDTIFIDQGSLLSDVGYGFDFVNGALTTLPALLTATADDKSREYGLANPAFTVTYSGFVNGDDESAILVAPMIGTLADMTSDVGNYAIDLDEAFASNYDFDYVPGTLTITRALLTVTADDASREYGLANPAFTGSITGFRNSDDGSVVGGLIYGSIADITSNAGLYDILGSGGTATNYDFDYIAGTLTITKALLTVTADDASREYGLADPALTGVISGFRNSDDESVISGLTYASNALTTSDVGLYDIFGSGASATNYDFDFIPGTLEITRALLTVTADDASREYGLANPIFTGSITGFRNSDDGSVVGGLIYGSIADITSNAGLYDILGSGGTATNYDFDYIAGTLTITKALLTVTADDASREYGLADPTLTGVISGFRNSDDESVIAGLTYGSNALITSDVGLYDIFGSGATSTNYDFAYIPGTLTITKALLTVMADNQTREYGLENPVLTSTISGLRNGDGPGVVSGLSLVTAANSASTVGDYAIAVSGGSALNYDFAYVPGTLSIAKALLTVQVDSKTRVYGATNPALTASITGFRNGDSDAVVSGLRLRTGAIARTNAGDYLISGSGAVATNYQFAYIPGTMTITKALLQVRIANASREYGLADPVFTSTITGFRNGDTASVISGLVLSSNAAIGSDVGTYAITGSGASALNYDFAYTPGRLVIDQARLLITADSLVMDHGSGDPVMTVNYSGLRAGDSSDVVTGLVLRSSSGGNASPGQYIINASRGTARNYQITYRPGVMTVLPPIVPPIQGPPSSSAPVITPPPVFSPPVVFPPVVTPPPAPIPPDLGDAAMPAPLTGAADSAEQTPGVATADVAPTPPAPVASLSAVTIAGPGPVLLSVAPEDLSPIQAVQSMAGSMPLPMMVTPDASPVTDLVPVPFVQDDGQTTGCQYISLCNGVLKPLWTFQPSQ